MFSLLTWYHPFLITDIQNFMITPYTNNLYRVSQIISLIAWKTKTRKTGLLFE